MTSRHREVEGRFRALLEDNGLPAPDDVGYERESVVFYWHGPNVVVAVDFEDEEAAC